VAKARYLLKQCRRWEDQEVIIWRHVRRATNEALLQLFGDERCTSVFGNEGGGGVAREAAGGEEQGGSE
jgi:hypothetical protein